DYGRERLGMSGRTAQELSRLARELRDRPLLASAVRQGEVSRRKAQTILAVARGEAEAGWVERARVETVRALEAAVAAAAGAAPQEEEDWENVWVSLTPAQRETFDEAMAVAGRVLGATAPAWQRIEALCTEFLGSHAAEVGEEEGGLLRIRLDAPWLAAAKEALERETRRWTFLDELSPPEVVAVPERELPSDPVQLDAELRELLALRDGWDEVMGHLALLLKMLGLWRDMEFATFGHYCTERLGMSARTVEQRAWLARRFFFLPGLKEALREGRVSYEQARLVARCADDESIASWIERAEGLTCIALRREIEAHEATQMRAQGALDARVPRRIANLISAAFRAVREAAGHWVGPGECLETIARHFIETWKEGLASPRTRQAKAIARDRGYCQVPGCSRAAVHAHHIRFRSAGGSDDLANLTGLCAAHHLVAVHRGYLRVRGEAPDRLVWETALSAAS
ncbi:MAG TPA: HNH endonuclease signature motif containing protein, partial [Anaeromyxobacteraceae bacterium]|nr:HNH endonuclease signature motif containing protein [Anaeromyxobacteraceae bacterium]